MPKASRQARQSKPQHEGSYVSLAGSVSKTIPEERPDIFSKTKMCKFHLIGACARGSACMFAHSTDELNQTPDLFRTKICKTLINTGSCQDSKCKYAHSKEELRISSIVTRPKHVAQTQRRQQKVSVGRSSRVGPVTSTPALLPPGQVLGGPVAPGVLRGSAGAPEAVVFSEAALLAQEDEGVYFTDSDLEDDQQPVFARMKSCPLPQTNTSGLDGLSKLRSNELMPASTTSADLVDDRLSKLNDLFCSSTPITVKNTFLEFETDKVGELKSVRSCPGLLDAMAYPLLEEDD